MEKDNILNRKKIFLYAFILWTILNLSGIKNGIFKEVQGSRVVVSKLCHLIFLYVLFYAIATLFYRRKEKYYKNVIIISGIYFFITMTGLLLLWPGTWSWDDVFVLNSAQWWGFSPWQHFFSGLFHILCLQTLPFSAGVIVMQLLIASLIVGYCVVSASHNVNSQKINMYVLQGIFLLITLLPPVLTYIYSGFRMGIYSYFELFLVIKLWNTFRREKIEKMEYVHLVLLVILVAAWRTEGLYYVGILLLFFVIFKGKSSKVANIISVVVAVVLVFFIGKINNHMIGNEEYSMVSTLTHVTEIAHVCDKTKVEQELQALDKVIDMDLVYNNSAKDVISLYWAHKLMREGYTEEQQKDYWKSYIRLMEKYPVTALKTMTRLFLESSGVIIDQDGYSLQTTVVSKDASTLDLFQENTGQAKSWLDLYSVWKYPINESLREHLIHFLTCTNSEGKVNVFYFLFWNVLLPVAGLIVCIIYEIYRKDLKSLLLLLAVFIRVPIIIATAPASYFMYYLSVYLVGWFMIVAVVVDRKEKRE